VLDGLGGEEIGIGFVDETSPQTTANTARVWSEGLPVVKKEHGEVEGKCFWVLPLERGGGDPLRIGLQGGDIY
jgi:hypothetical protein